MPSKTKRPARKAKSKAKRASSNGIARQYSSHVTETVERAPSRAMLHAVGFTDRDFKKPMIGVASTQSMVTPCNMHVGELAKEVGKGID
ncbi:MAG: dihydroxy-acid dehydratase, partial [Candidatus Hydrogenedentes bacterium]|nr:dihydroxy-acid dehydratase [Candidatus Hydrogenedentota bacterium]